MEYYYRFMKISTVILLWLLNGLASKK